MVTYAEMMSTGQQTIIHLLVGAGLIIGLAATFWHRPDQYDLEPVQGLDAPTVSLVVAKASPLVVPFTATGRPLGGVVLYAADDATATAAVDVTIQDNAGKTLARSRRQTTLYPSSGAAALHVRLSSLAMAAGQPLRLVVSPRERQPLQLLANEAREERPAPQLIFSALYRRPLSAGERQGILIGTAVGLGCLLLYYLRPRPVSIQWAVAAAIITAAAGLATLPYVYRPAAQGIGDWDYRYSLAHIYTATLRDHHQLPFWNPYICGGTAALGDPEFALFTPSFVLQAIVGVAAGTALALVGGLIWTGLGMLWLARQVGQPPLAAVTAALTVLLSSALMLKMTVGHVTIVWAYMWVPWLLGAWLNGYRLRADKNDRHMPWVFSCGVILALMLLQGGIYILSYTLVVFLGLIICSRRRAAALSVSAWASMWMLGLSAFQLMPTLYWMREFPDQAFVGSAATYARLADIFFGRYLQNEFVLPHQLSQWHEYGAYVGYGVLVLALLGAARGRSSRVVRILLIGVAAIIVLSASGPLVAPLWQHLSFLPRSNISRLALFAVVGIGLLAGFGTQRVLALPSRYALLAVIAAAYIAIDLASLAYPIAAQGFVVPRVAMPPPRAAYPIEYTRETYTARHQGIDIPRSFTAVRQGYGTFSFCAPLGPVDAVVVTGASPASARYLTVSPPYEAKVVFWSPNTITLAYAAPEAVTVTLNANYASGWQTSVGSIIPGRTRLTVELPPGDQLVTLRYRPPGSIVGLLVTAATLVVVFSNRTVVLGGGGTRDGMKRRIFRTHGCSSRAWNDHDPV